jgi:hypothetical protein
MRARNLKSFAPLGGKPAVLLAGMLLLGAVTANANEENKSHNSVQGTWRLTIMVRTVTDPQTGDCGTGDVLRAFPALIAFAKGGTLTLTTAGQLPSLFTPGLGVWRHTEGNNYSAVSEQFVFSPSGVWMQTHRLTRAIEVDNDADQFTENVKLQILDTAGNVIATGCATGIGTRLELTRED